MARPRLPTAIARERGLFDKNPDRERARADEPEAEELGEPPKRLSKVQREAWAEIVDAHPPGVLTKMDRAMVELAARLTAQMWTEPRFNKENQLAAALGRLGMTPTDRSKVHQDKSKVPARGFGALRRGTVAQGAQAS